MRDTFTAEVDALTYGDVTDLENFGGALIDRRAYDKNVAAIERARSATGLEIAVGGKYDDSVGYFVRPTVLLADDPADEAMTTEYFGPILTVHVYDDSAPNAFADVLATVDSAAPYALTGAVIADDRQAVEQATSALRFTAGNFYVNDKPTGAVVGQQPFGGGPRLGHERQGRVQAQPAAVGVGPHHQGDVRPRHRLPISAHGGRNESAHGSGESAAPGDPRGGPVFPRQTGGHRRPVTRKLVDRFVAGENRESALATVREILDSGRSVSIDFLGEDTRDAAGAQATVDEYLALVADLGALPEAAEGTSGVRRLEVSMKLSALAGTRRRRSQDRHRQRPHDLRRRGGGRGCG